jgi:hypothetical protein
MISKFTLTSAFTAKGFLIFKLLTATETGEIRGQLLDCNRKPVPKQEICYQIYLNNLPQANTYCDKTNTDGIFKFTDLEPGVYGVFVSGDRWRTTRYRDIRVEPNRRVDLFFKLMPAPGQNLSCIL